MIFVIWTLWVTLGTRTALAARPHSGGLGLGGPLNNDALALQDPVGCSGALISLQEACSRSVFVAMASSVASSIDCELQRTNNVVEIFSQIFQRADAAELKSQKSQKMSRKSAESSESDSKSTESSEEIPEIPRFKDTKLCKKSPTCWNCNGIRYAKYADRTIVMLPQPNSTGKHYAYNADKPREIQNNEKLQIDEKEIEKGLRYASLGSGIDDFEESKKVFFTPRLHTRLQYFGNDPALVVDLWKSKSSGRLDSSPGPDGSGSSSGSSACNVRGPPPQNRVPELLGFATPTPTATRSSRSSRSRVSWSAAAESRTTGDLTSQASAAAYKREMDNSETMGAVTMTVNMTYLGEALGELPLSPNVYAMIADPDGRVTMMTPRARDTVFHKNMSESQIRNPENQRPCQVDAVGDNDCWWDAPKPLTLLNAQEEEKFSRINFKEMLQHVFNDSLSENHSCSSGVRTWTLDVPHCDGKTCAGQHCGCQHLAVFCRLVGFPEWAMFVLAPLEELQGAATFAVDKENISVDYIEKKGDVYEDHIVVHNTGRVHLPFSATVSAGKGDGTSLHVTVDPANGTLAPGENATLALKFNLSSFGYGTSSGLVNVQADLSDDTGTCFRNRTGTRFLFTRRKYPTLLHVSGISVSVIATVVLFIILYRVVSSFLRKYYDDLAKEQGTIEKALEATQELAFPMVLLKVETFKKHGKFVAFEDILSESLWLHTIQDIDDFLTKDIKEQLGKKNKVIFMSHQWTAFGEPDHTGDQYRGMVEAVDNVIQQNRWIEEDTYVWLDYSSIPQRHRPSQTAAINSLTVYAAKVSAFIVVAPKVNHKDLEGVLCNEDSYKKRAWCRAEQLSHLLAQAGDNMYLAKQKEPGQSMPGFLRLNDDAAWLEQSIEVFKGELTCCRRKHVGMDMCDRERLVVPMLGLWAQLCRTVRGQALENEDMSEDDKRPFADLKEIHKHLSERIGEVFPATFTYEFEDGTEERTLFGKLVQRLEEKLEKEVVQRKEEKKNQWSKLRIASKIRLPSNGGRRLSQALRASEHSERA